MDENFGTKLILEFNIKVEFIDDRYNYFVIRIDQTSSIPHSTYESELTKKDLDIASRYFQMLNDISQLFTELQNMF